jgi:hypothetical protein
MLHWRATTGSGDLWDHRAYWGVNALTWGTDGQPSRRRIGESLPPTGRWVRLEIPASAVDLEGKTVAGFSFSLYKGRGAFDRIGKVSGDLVWVDEDADIPVASRNWDPKDGTEMWEVLDAQANPKPNPLPISGRYAFRTKNTTGDNPQFTHQLYFENATTTRPVNGGDVLFAYIYLDPVNPPEELMLQWRASTGTGYLWDHRAYWGPNWEG